MIIAQCIHNITMSYGLVISMLLAGLVGGATHCAGMCAPFVLAQVDDSLQMKRLRSSLLLPYHLGRMTTYVVLAVLVSSVLNLAFVFSGLRALIAAPMLVLAGVIFLVSAFPGLLVLFPWAGGVRVSVPYRFISGAAGKLMGNSSVIGRYGLGVLLGFMPCGLVVSALLASASAPSVLQAAIAMAAFTLGTMPALILVAFGGNILKKRYPKAARHVSQGAMAIGAIWLFTLAGFMLI